MRSTRFLVPVLMLSAIACSKGRDKAADTDSEIDESVEHDSANARAKGMREWYRERDHGEIWSREYRAYLLDVARAERIKYANLMPGAKTANLIGGSQWKSIGPTDANSGPNGGGAPVTDAGRITAIIPDGTRLFVATAGGGVWRRENNTWTPLSETIGSLSCGTLAMDPTDHDRLYLGLGDSFDGTGVGLLISTDGGDNWSDPILLGDSMIIPTIAIDPANPSVVLVGTDKGLYRSTNAGTSFSKIDINTGLAGGPYIWSIAYTGSKGFALSLGQIPEDSSVTTDGQIWYTGDDGATWTKANGVSAASGVGRITVASAPSSPTTLYALAGQPNADSNSDLADIFKSTDGGKNWTALAVAAKKYSNSSSRLGSLLNAQGWYNQLVLVDPQSPSTAYFGGALLLAKTTDGGTTFRAETDWLGGSRPYVHADFHAGALDSSGLYVGTDGGVFLSTDAGTSFSSSLNKGMVTHLLYSVGSSPAAPNAVIGGMQDNGTRVREAATSTFDEVVGGDGFGAAVHRTNGQRMLGSLYYDGIVSSSDGGQNWIDATTGINEANDSNNAPFITVLVPWEGPNSTGNEIYTYSNTRVYKSTNFGNSWTALATSPVPSDRIIRGMGVAATDAKIIGVVSSGGGVFLSKDGGSTWATVADGKLGDPMSLPNSDRSMNSIHFDVSNANTVYVSSVAPQASVNHLWKSTDFGAHWTTIDGNGLPAGVPINVVKSDPVPENMPGKVVYVGTQMGVYRSDDGGATWSRFGAGMPLVSVMDLYISPDESIVRAATFGRGFWELTTPTDDFTINADGVTVAPGMSGTTAIHTMVRAGVAKDVALTVTGLPAGVTASIDPTSVLAGGDAAMTITADASAVEGNYTLTLTGTSSEATHSVSVGLAIAAGGGFTIDLNPASLQADQGVSVFTTVNVTLVSGAAMPVDLTVAGLPDGTTATFDSPTVNGGESTRLVIATTSATPVGTYSITVTGTTPVTSHSATLTLDVGMPGTGETGQHGGCCSASSSGETAGNVMLAFGVAIFVGGRRRRRHASQSSAGH
ncbi:MAG TPA: hypothetical protein VL463_27130 [Kofleriaceae bacterium]|nr:hypothetical protein [Kofleriaceae bacterium]